MADRLVTYLKLHQPRRPKLPAQPIPRDLPVEEWGDWIFDETMNRFCLEKLARLSYHPATDLFLDLVEEGFCLGIGLSWTFLEQVRQWDMPLYAKLRRLLSHPNVEPVGVEPYHSFLFFLDIERFVERMKWAKEQLADFAEKPVRITDTTEMFMSNDLYYALAQAGFDAVLMDGRDWVMEWRQSSYLYHAESSPKIFCRHNSLSNDIGLRFSDRNWNGFPLLSDTYASWIGEATGDLILVGWDFETFGQRHTKTSGIFEFMRRLPEDLKVRGVFSMTPSQALEELKDESRSLHLPAFPCTWAGNGGAEYFIGNDLQQAVFQLMHHAYNKARLTQVPRLVDLAMQLLMSDNLRTLQWAPYSGTEAEIQDVYKQFIQACDDQVHLEKVVRAAKPPADLKAVLTG